MSTLKLSPRERQVLEDALLLAIENLDGQAHDTCFSKTSRNGARTKQLQITNLYKDVVGASVDAIAVPPSFAASFDHNVNGSSSDSLGDLFACN